MKPTHLLIAGFFFISACSNSSKGSAVPNNAESTVKWSKLKSGNQCSMEAALNAVITSQEQLDEIWLKAFTMDMPPEKLNVDFTKNSVVVLFLGSVNKGGHSIEITGIKSNTDKGFQIGAEHKLPGKNCMSSMAIEFPYFIGLTDIVLSGKTEFTVTKKEIDCEL